MQATKQTEVLIKAALIAAFEQLPDTVVESDNGYCKAVFLDYFNSNQLLLAMEELDGVIEDNSSPSKAFWQHLSKAAGLMNNRHLVKYQSILSAIYKE